jgi:3'(2'),5'-bisphosphate nucleotidase
MIPDNKQANELIKLAFLAGKEILKIYKTPFIKKIKRDNSPVTKADIISNEIICSGLKKLFPDIPIISEENIKNPVNKNNFFWLVDPLDGTKEFIKKNGEFTVNIALIKNKRPVYGLIYMPTTKEIYFTKNKSSYYSKIDSKGKLIKKSKISTKKRSKNIIVLSRSHIKDFNFIMEKFNATKVIQTGSSIKLCYIAHGKANIYPRLGTTMEWDIAAGDAILRKAGGHIKTLDGKVLKYGKTNLKNKSFIARN